MITIGTDCSGIEAPIEALKQLNIPFIHKWSCEIDKFARQSILANSPPEIMYEDITKRNHYLLPDIDIYVCGFPCQPFSLMGRKLGTSDTRSNIMMHCINVIKIKQPQIFILENVKNFRFIESGRPFNYLINELSNITNENQTNEFTYNIYWDIYNTKDYGIPQNRERIYIIGIRQDIQIDDFIKPNPIPMRSLDEFIIDKTIYNMNISKSLQKNINIGSNNTYIFTPFSYYFPLVNVCPTLTTRCHCFYHKIYKRNLTPKECLLLQGFTLNFNQIISNTQMYKQIGNSMSVNVLKHIFNQLLKCTLLQELI